MKKFQHDNTFNVLYFIANSTPTMMTTMENDILFSSHSMRALIIRTTFAQYIYRFTH